MGKTHRHEDGFAIGTEKEIVIQKFEDPMTLPRVTHELHKNPMTITLVTAVTRVTQTHWLNFPTTQQTTSTISGWKEK